MKPNDEKVHASVVNPSFDGLNNIDGTTKYDDGVPHVNKVFSDTSTTTSHLNGGELI